MNLQGTKTKNCIFLLGPLYRQSQLWFKYLKIKFKTKRKQKSSGGHSPSLAGPYERLVDETKAKQQNRVIKKNQYKQQQQQQQETMRDRKIERQ